MPFCEWLAESFAPAQNKGQVFSSVAPVMSGIIQPSQCRNPDTVAVARWLLGKQLVVGTGKSAQSSRITEVEAYDGPGDRACHASKGRTARTEVMFAPGGVWYVYLVYGMYEMLNLVTGPADYPAAVLIRGIELASGPGRLTRALKIDRRFNALPAIQATGLWIEHDGFEPPESEVEATPRVGIDYAGEPWVSKPWRFLWKH
jgi:DNA-3-methyladenine glycosylase